MTSEVWLQIAGFGTWLVSSLVTNVAILRGELPWSRAGLFLLAFAMFGGAFGLACRLRSRQPSMVGALLLVQSLASLTMVAAGHDVLVAATLVVVAGQVPWTFEWRESALWVAAQTALLGLVVSGFGAAVAAFTLAASFGGFQLFAVATAFLALRERAARDALARANAELRATRALVAESSRTAERVRIARDLHDTLGHHLTALSLQLDVASRLADGRASQHIEEAHAVARLLLADVRDTVSRFRETPSRGISEALRALVPASAPFEVHLDVTDTHIDLAPDRAEVIIRCVQEVLTNAARHAEARPVWVRVSEDADDVVVHARDDGRGVSAVAWGNGLTGMRERFEAFAGRLEIRTSAGGGFEVIGRMPRAMAS